MRNLLCFITLYIEGRPLAVILRAPFLFCRVTTNGGLSQTLNLHQVFLNSVSSWKRGLHGKGRALVPQVSSKMSLVPFHFFMIPVRGSRRDGTQLRASAVISLGGGHRSRLGDLPAGGDSHWQRLSTARAGGKLRGCCARWQQPLSIFQLLLLEWQTTRGVSGNCFCGWLWEKSLLPVSSSDSCLWERTSQRRFSERAVLCLLETRLRNLQSNAVVPTRPAAPLDPLGALTPVTPRTNSDTRWGAQEAHSCSFLPSVLIQVNGKISSSFHSCI